MDEARELSATRAKGRRPCVVAKAIQAAGISDEDARELLRSPDVDAIVKYDVFTSHGMDASKSTFQGKVTKGCRCGWCEEFGCGPDGIDSL